MDIGATEAKVFIAAVNKYANRFLVSIPVPKTLSMGPTSVYHHPKIPALLIPSAIVTNFQNVVLGMTPFKGACPKASTPNELKNASNL